MTEERVEGRTTSADVSEGKEERGKVAAWTQRCPLGVVREKVSGSVVFS
jgi:hypothetical protein